MKIEVTKTLIMRFIAYAEAFAHEEAGHSQSPDLIEYENTRAFKDAQLFRAKLKVMEQFNPSNVK